MNINCTQHFIRVIVHSALLHLNSKCRSGIPSYSYLVRRSRSLSSKKLPLPERALVNQQVNCTTIGWHELNLAPFQAFKESASILLFISLRPPPCAKLQKRKYICSRRARNGPWYFFKTLSDKWIDNEMQDISDCWTSLFNSSICSQIRGSSAPCRFTMELRMSSEAHK